MRADETQYDVPEALPVCDDSMRVVEAARVALHKQRQEVTLLKAQLALANKRAKTLARLLKNYR